MTEFRKNNFREEVIEQHGVTAGLPLFESANKTLSNKTQSRFDAAPKSIPTGNDAKRLHRVSQKINEVQLNDDCQIVFDAFAFLGPSTNKEVSTYLKAMYPEPKDKWEASTVNARNFELRQYGKMKASKEKRVCTITGKIVTEWEVIQTENAS
ncbi:MAG: hypothetical protein HYV29_01695 [Ignavibacteriales bacterium]|nr:hypothetical protein [Ignavibacteriales bacterium]